MTRNDIRLITGVLHRAKLSCSNSEHAIIARLKVRDDLSEAIALDVRAARLFSLNSFNNACESGTLYNHVRRRRR